MWPSARARDGNAGARLGWLPTHGLTSWKHYIGPVIALSGFSLAFVARLARSLTDARFEAGDVLWEAGQPSGYLYVVLSGRAVCSRPGDPGRFRCGGGYPMGNIESLAGERRWYTATAETPMWVVRANSDAFLDVIEDDFEMAMSFIESFASNLIRIRRQKTERMLEPVEVP